MNGPGKNINVPVQGNSNSQLTEACKLWWQCIYLFIYFVPPCVNLFAVKNVQKQCFVIFFHISL